MKLHAINHTNGSQLWCGPAAISAVTGRDTRSIHQCIRDITGKRLVTGLNENHLCRTLTALGATFKRAGAAECVCNGSVTLAAWLRKNKALYATTPVIIRLTGHYVTVFGRMLVDNHTPGDKPVFLKDAPWRRKRVKSYVQILSVGGTATWSAPAPVMRPPGYWAEVKKRGELLKLAQVHGISVEQHNPGEWWVYPPFEKVNSEADPYEIEGHLAFNASERAERITKYLQLLNVPVPA